MNQDLMTECKAPEKEYQSKVSKRKRPARIIFCDAIGKCGGVAARAFDNVSDLLKRAMSVVTSCGCQEGCEQCIRSPFCKEGNVVSSKAGADLVLRMLLGSDIDPIAVAVEEGSPQSDTIIPAQAVRALNGIQVESDKVSIN